MSLEDSMTPDLRVSSVERQNQHELRPKLKPWVVPGTCETVKTAILNHPL